MALNRLRSGAGGRDATRHEHARRRTAHYPVPWSVQTWLPGVTGDDADPSSKPAFARDLAEFIAGVRTIDTRGRKFAGQARGGDLKDHDDEMSTCLKQSEGLLDVERLTRMWAAFRELPREAPT